MTIQIRQAEKRDAAGLYNAWQAARTHYASVDRRIINAPISEAEFTTSIESILGRASSVTFVADDEGRLVGFIRGVIEVQAPDRLPERHATVGYLYVDPAYRRMGLGEGLFRAVAEWAAGQDGVSHFEMTVPAADEQASGFWRKLGFTPFIERLWAPLSAADGHE